LKIAISGKGGVGKSTVTSIIASEFKKNGSKVILIDADPDMNLATILGFPDADKVTPIIELKELIAERTESKPGTSAPVFKMNPKVDDIPDEYSLKKDDMKLMVMGSVRHGGAGCACPQNAFLKQLLGHLILLRDEVVILDMEAGIEHLGRATTGNVDVLLVIVEPSNTSLETAHRIKKLSIDIGIKTLGMIANKVDTEEDLAFIKEKVTDISLLGHLSFSSEVRNLSTGRNTDFVFSEKTHTEIQKIYKNIRETASGSH
jgi:CO dehydrogenase maturation factor